MKTTFHFNHFITGDIKLLREQIARQRVGTTDEGMNTRHFPAHEREELVNKLEESKDQVWSWSSISYCIFNMRPTLFEFCPTDVHTISTKTGGML